MILIGCNIYKHALYVLNMYEYILVSVVSLANKAAKLGEKKENDDKKMHVSFFSRTLTALSSNLLIDTNIYAFMHH
jgi:hypothetical protein